MSATSAATFVKKSVGWSIGLSVLMIVAGDISDRFAPGCRNRGQRVGRLAARFQRMRPSGVCLVYAKHAEAFSGSCCSGLFTFSSAYICSCIRWPV